MQRTAAALLVLLSLSACARLGLGAGGSQPPIGPSAVGKADLQGAWLLRHGTGPGGDISVPAGSRITIAFDGDRVSGSACNLYGGTYRLGDHGDLTLSAMAMTEMACQEPLMTLEATYHAALQLVRNAAIQGNTLTLTGDGVELVYDREPPTPDAPLQVTYRNLETLVQGETATTVPGKARLVLNADGTQDGNTRCRDITATYDLEGGSGIVVHRLVNTDVACDPGVAVQDQQVLDVIGSSPHFRITGDRLTLTGTDGKGLEYGAGQR
jgi:heat shock protein HslJ